MVTETHLFSMHVLRREEDKVILKVLNKRNGDCISDESGLDGYTALFFQKAWPFIGSDITESVLKILNGNVELHDWNSALITLIEDKSSTIA